MRAALVVGLLAFGALVGCGVSVEDPAPDSPEVLMSVESSLAASTPCYAGEVGDVRWANDETCCSNAKQRLRRQRCDGRYWRNTATTTCSSSRCGF
jgi:collagenase-like PrtC family protease